VTIERKSADNIHGFVTRAEAERYCDQDLLIRQGMCPNGHGLMQLDEDPPCPGQKCGKCNFWTNALAEKERAN
jgi:hypothetical protein